MGSQMNSSTELYNLRWNSYFSNLMTMVGDHQDQEALVDVSLSCEGQFIKAHKLILSACSVYFQRIFEEHTTSPLLVLLNNVKFKDLQLVIQFMYKGEVKVADSEMQEFLSLAKMLQVKGLCSVEFQDKLKQPDDPTQYTKEKIAHIEKITAQNSKIPKDKESNGCVSEMKTTIPKKRKLHLSTSVEEQTVNKNIKTSTSSKPVPYIPRPPNAFMIFANLWRKKLAVEYPEDTTKDISIRLGNIWKSLSKETKDSFYDDAKTAEEAHRLRYSGYFYHPRDAVNRKVSSTDNKTSQTQSGVVHVDINDFNEDEFIEI